MIRTAAAVRLAPADQHPVIVICPYLQLDKPHTIGPWWIGPASQFPGPWNPSELKNVTEVLLRKFVDVKGDPVINPTLIARLDHGAGETMPDFDTINALRLAVAFATLSQNPTLPYKPWDAWTAISADNVDVWFQPVDLNEHTITLSRGSRIETMEPVHVVASDLFVVPPPLELPSARTATFDDRIARAVYDVVIRPHTTSNEDAARLAQAVRWWTKAWANSASISDEDRVVFYKTAIDTLTDTDKTHIAGQRLTDLFESLSEDQRNGLMWQPNQARYDRVHRHQTYPSLPAIEHWTLAFGDCRNDIAHRGRTESLVYTHEDSPYNGPILATADRLIREALVVTLALLGHGELLMHPHHGAIQQLLDAAAVNAVIPTFDATATMAENGWQVTVDDHPAIAVHVAELSLADTAIGSQIASALKLDPAGFEVYVIPLII